MSAEVWTGPAAIAAGVLVVAGVAKTLRPGDTARALEAARLPGGSGLVRVGALVEAGLGGWALVSAAPAPMLAVAGSYAGFAIFLVVAMARGLPVSSCGCFGEPDVPPTWLHVGVDVAAGIAAMGAAVSKAPTVATVLADQPAAGLPYAALLVVGLLLTVLALTRLPRLRALGDAIGARS